MPQPSLPTTRDASPPVVVLHPTASPATSPASDLAALPPVSDRGRTAHTRPPSRVRRSRIACDAKRH